MLADVRDLELEDLVVRHHLDVLDVEGLVEIDVFLVERIPEMVVVALMILSKAVERFS
ncbi:MAG: hypothetical protein WDM81_18320 [Rhizomicrobium sp.]